MSLEQRAAVDARLRLDHSIRLATRAAAAGVDVILDVSADVPHVFQLYAGTLDEADAALDRAGRFILDRQASQQSGQPG